MKKYIIMALLLAGVSAQAQERLTPDPSPKGEGSHYLTKEQAREIASEFFVTNLAPSHPRTPASPNIKLAYQAPKLYVFNDAESKGFVIVSGNEQANPILGWSDNGPFDYENAPCGLKALLELYSLTPDPSPKGEGRDYLQTQNIDTKHTTPLSRGEGVGERHPLTPRKTEAVVGPLLTTQWNQREPYNHQCPTNASGTPYVTGCVQTSIAQIMKYYQWPIQGRGKHTNQARLSQTRDLSQSVYDWDNMLDVYVEGEYNDTQANAVAQLMADIGCVMNASYGTFNGTQTTTLTDDMVPILGKYFCYREEKITVETSYEGPNTPVQPLVQHLDAGHPVIIEVQLLEGQWHNVVCDGYKVENGTYYYHVNFGWGGESDGWYLNDPETVFTGWGNGVALVPMDDIMAEKNGVYFNVADDEATVMCTTDADPDKSCFVTIPETVEAEGQSYPVTHIDDYAFIGSAITSLTIPGSIKKIPEKLFYFGGKVPLNSLSLGDGIEEVGDSAFMNCTNLKSGLTFGTALRRVGKCAFRGTGVMGITFYGNGFTIGDNAFSNSLMWANGLEGAAEIGSWAINGDMGGTFTVQPTCQYGNHAVQGKYDCIYIPNSVSDFNALTVMGTAAYQVDKDHPAYSTANGTLYNKDRSRLIRQPEVRNWLQYSERTWALMPATVTAIDPHAFYNDVKFFTFPNSITKLDGILSQSPDLREVSCMSAIPPELTDAEELSEKLKNNVNSKLFVPIGSKSAYEQTEGWKDFHSIQECLFSDGHYWYHTYPEFQRRSAISITWSLTSRTSR